MHDEAEDLHGLMSVEAALAHMAGWLPRLPTATVPLHQAAGARLAEPVVCDLDDPPFNRALMDGFAVRSADCTGSNTTLSIAGELAAGSITSQNLQPGTALRINTGAPLPTGADAVVMIEHCRLSADGAQVSFTERPTPGRFIAPQGCHVRAGRAVLPAGTWLGPAQVAAAAAAGASTLQVHQRPRMTVLTTGNELVGPERRPADGQIRDANRPMMMALAQRFGCTPSDLGSVRDQRDELLQAIHRGLQADVLCISGGVSMGQYDLVPDVLESAGVNMQVRKVTIKPGKPLHIGLGPAGQVVFGLPGNPASTFVCFWIFVRAALAGMQGGPVGLPPTWPAVLTGPLKPAGPRQAYVPARLVPDATGSMQASPIPWQGSGDVFALARADALIVRPADDPEYPPGRSVQVLPLVP